MVCGTGPNLVRGNYGAQVDAVFVTVEPNGESHKPSGKSLLFAYSIVNPNYP